MKIPVFVEWLALICTWASLSFCTWADPVGWNRCGRQAETFRRSSVVWRSGQQVMSDSKTKQQYSLWWLSSPGWEFCRSRSRTTKTSSCLAATSRVSPAKTTGSSCPKNCNRFCIRPSPRGPSSRNFHCPRPPPSARASGRAGELFRRTLSWSLRETLCTFSWWRCWKCNRCRDWRTLVWNRKMRREWVCVLSVQLSLVILRYGNFWTVGF